jgi:hypothetical protein
MGIFVPTCGEVAKIIKWEDDTNNSLVRPYFLIYIHTISNEFLAEQRIFLIIGRYIYLMCDLTVALEPLKQCR